MHEYLLVVAVEDIVSGSVAMVLVEYQGPSGMIFSQEGGYPCICRGSFPTDSRNFPTASSGGRRCKMPIVTEE